MKRFKIDDMEDLYVGTAAEIKALYRSIYRAACGRPHTWKTNMYPLYEGIPKFNAGRMYGLVIDENLWFHIVGEHTALDIISDCYSLEVVA